MTDKKIIIAHHSANQQEVNDITQNLSRAGYAFEQLACNHSDARLYQRIKETNNSIILLISDNFLRCEDCMFELLPTFQDLIRSNRIKAVVADGVYKDEETGIITTKPTSFDRVSSVIQYMNYWQDQYLDVRRQKRQVPYEKEAVLNDQLKVIRSISSEIGEFLRFLRNRDHTTYQEFRANNFYSFFAFTNDLGIHGQFEAAPFQAEERFLPEENQTYEPEMVEPVITPVETISTTEPEVELSGIPGMDMLSDLEVPEIPTDMTVETQETADEVENLDNLIVAEPIPDISELIEEVPVETAVVEEEALAIPELIAPETEKILPTVSEEESLIEEEEEVTVEEEVVEERQMDAVTEMPVASEEEQVAVPVEAEIEVSETASNPSLASILELGNQQIQEGNFYTALHTYEDGLKIYPESPALRYTYAKGLLKYREDVAGTKKQLKTLLEHDPQNTDAFYLLGEIEEIQENYAAAKSNLEQVIDIDSNYPNANYRLANLLANKFDGMEENAAQYFAAAIAQDGQNADAHYQYAILQDEFFNNKELAIEHFQQTVQYQTDHPFAHYDLAVLYHGLNQKEAAKTAYEKATTLNLEVKTPQNDQVFLGIDPVVEEEILKAETNTSEIEASKELIHKLQEDIKRLEDLVLKNQNLLQTAQNDIANLPVAETPAEEEESVPLA
ncbi:MAG: hypothetical protein AAF599_13765, partial [Bacteroidota bacterium]